MTRTISPSGYDGSALWVDTATGAVVGGSVPIPDAAEERLDFLTQAELCRYCGRVLRTSGIKFSIRVCDERGPWVVDLNSDARSCVTPLGCHIAVPHGIGTSLVRRSRIEKLKRCVGATRGLWDSMQLLGHLAREIARRDWAEVGLDPRHTATPSAYREVVGDDGIAGPDAFAQMLGKPERELVAAYLLSGIARCWSCGGALTAVKKQRDRARYYCSARYSRGAAFCPNSHGVPLAPLDESVRDALRALLTERPDAVAALCEERDARLRAEQATAGDTREQAMVEAAGLEKEIGRLVKALASGAASEDVTAAINERRTKVEALKATPAPAAPFDRAEFFRRFAGVRKVAMLIEPLYPAQARQVLRKLGVEKIVVTPDGEGWTFEGSADLAPYLGAEPLVGIGAPGFSARPGVPVE